MFHNYGCGGKHTSKRDEPTERNKKRLEAKKLKRPSLCIGNIRITLSKDILR